MRRVPTELEHRVPPQRLEHPVDVARVVRRARVLGSVTVDVDRRRDRRLERRTAR